MSNLKAFPVEVVVYIDADTPLGDIFAAADEDTQREIAVDTLRRQLIHANVGSNTCRMAVAGDDPGFDTTPGATPHNDSIPA